MLLLLTFPILAAGLASPGSEQDAVLHLPLFRRSLIHRNDGVVDLDRLASSAEALRLKHGFKDVDGPNRRANEADISMINLVSGVQTV